MIRFISKRDELRLGLLEGLKDLAWKTFREDYEDVIEAGLKFEEEWKNHYLKGSCLAEIIEIVEELGYTIDEMKKDIWQNYLDHHLLSEPLSEPLSEQPPTP